MISLDERSGAPCVVLLSGGMDSSVVLAFAIESGFRARALTVSYGQRARGEIAAAEAVARSMGLEREDHLVLPVDLKRVGGSALTSDAHLPDGEEAGRGIPRTYVPARNTVLLSLALSWAEALGARDLFVGVSAVDYSGYPDCRPEFVGSFEAVANAGTRAVEGGPPYRVHAPLIGLSKGDTVRLGLELGVDFSLTRSCYSPGPDGRPCGRCASCLLRARGFAEAGRPDPSLEE